MARGRVNQALLYAFLACTLFVTSATAGLQSVKNITFTIPGAWYVVDGNFELDTAGTADIQTYSSAEYDYEVDNVALTMTPMAMLSDVSSGGQAIANFEGGGVLTFSGDLMAAGTSTVLYSGTILQADMVLGAGDVWQLKELNAFASIVNISGGVMGMEASNGGLNTGIAAGLDTLMIGDMNLAMQFITGGIADFSANRMANGPAIQITAAEVPEPATMLLLAVGGLGVFRKRSS